MSKKYKSIMGYDERYCPFCGSAATEWHHIIEGVTGRKKLSEEYGLMIRLCHTCHMDLHDRLPDTLAKLKGEAQDEFEIHYPDLNFLEIFGKNYNV